MRRIGGWWDEGGRKRTTETLSLYAEGKAGRGGWCGGVKTVTSLASRRYRFLETMPQAPFMHVCVHVCVCACVYTCMYAPPSPGGVLPGCVLSRLAGISCKG